MCKNRFRQACMNIGTCIKYITGSETLTFQPGTQLERQKRRATFLVALTICAIILVVLSYYIPWNKYYKEIAYRTIEKENWLGFIASFWGAIIGAVISGLATIVTTWLIIRRSYRIDYHRERIEFLPILQISTRNDIELELKESKRIQDIIRHYRIWNRAWEELPETFKVFEIRNVGKGIAIKPKIANEAEEAVFGVPSYASIVSQQSVLFIEDIDYVYNSEMVFSFFDIFDNFYMQKFSLEIDEEETIWNIQMSMPQLVLKTQRIRYEQ